MAEDRNIGQAVSRDLLDHQRTPFAAPEDRNLYFHVRSTQSLAASGRRSRRPTIATTY